MVINHQEVVAVTMPINPTAPRAETLTTKLAVAASKATRRQNPPMASQPRPPKSPKVKIKYKNHIFFSNFKTPSKTSRLDPAHVPVATVPLFENGRHVGEKVVPLKRSISEPPVKTEIKTELPDSGDFGQLLPNVHVKSEPL